MQGFRLEDDGGPYVLTPRKWCFLHDGHHCERGSAPPGPRKPGQRRIISAVAQVTSHWLTCPETLGSGRRLSSARYAKNAAFIEGPALSQALLQASCGRVFPRAAALRRLRQLFDPYFGGVHAIAWEGGRWVGAAAPGAMGVGMVEKYTVIIVPITALPGAFPKLIESAEAETFRH